MLLQKLNIKQKGLGNFLIETVSITEINVNKILMNS